MPRLRFLQTSDLHLRPDRPERQRALELVIEAAESRAADAVLVAGDLFDRDADAVAQRAAVRQIFERIAPRPVFVIPGNHDASGFEEGADLGENVTLLSATPVARAELGGLALLGVPYQRGRLGAECLAGVATDPRRTVLIAHGIRTDGPGGFAGEGEEGAGMPFTLEDLSRRSCYAALGHLHSGRQLVERRGEWLAAYAGSPVAISRRELGPRCALAVDFEVGAGVVACEEVPLATPFFELADATCSPGREEEAVAELCRRAAALRRPGARVRARLHGVTTLPDAELRELAERALKQAWRSLVPAAATEAPLLELATTSYAVLSRVPVIEEFVARLRARSASTPELDEETVEAALHLGLNAFVESLP